MSERAAYSRVYWTVIDDPKFELVYDDNDALATWLRLLLIADQAHPAPAHLPRGARAAVVNKLAKAGIVDLLPGDRYRIHGLAAERAWRKAEGARIRSRGASDAVRDTQTPHALRDTQSTPRSNGTQVREGDEYETRRGVDKTRRGREEEPTVQSTKGRLERIGVSDLPRSLR